MNEATFYLCEKCGNLAYMLQEGQGQLVCCGVPMKKLEAGAVDAAQEKHVPVAERDGNVLHVKVGSVPHPMMPKHYITWIAVVQGGRVQFAHLTPDDKPEATFTVEPGALRVYEYCNLHGLWTVEA